MTNKNPRPTIYSNLEDAFNDHNNESGDSYIGKRLSNMIKTSKRVERPPFPKQIQIETANICNHACEFCAYTLMERPKRQMEPDLFKRLVKEAFALGSREIGLFAGAEPLACKFIIEYIEFCKSIGYE